MRVDSTISNNKDFRNYMKTINQLNGMNYMRIKHIETYLRQNLSTMEHWDLLKTIEGFSTYFGVHTY
jgi:hypothetical protein